MAQRNRTGLCEDCSQWSPPGQPQYNALCGAICLLGAVFPQALRSVHSNPAADLSWEKCVCPDVGRQTDLVQWRGPTQKPEMGNGSRPHPLLGITKKRNKYKIYLLTLRYIFATLRSNFRRERRRLKLFATPTAEREIPGRDDPKRPATSWSLGVPYASTVLSEKTNSKKCGNRPGPWPVAISFWL